MVFGFGKKERRVPDLSRYDYYYQNKPDYNRSARLSAAAATAASSHNQNFYSQSARPRSQYQRSYSLDSPRPRTLSMYTSPSQHTSSYLSPHAQAQVQQAYLASAARRKPGARATNAARPPHIRPVAPRGSAGGTGGATNGTSYRTYSLRSQTSMPPPLETGHSPPLNGQRRHNSTLGTSVNSPRRAASNGVGARNLQRANSITTQVTEVKDPQGRTQSIVRKTIKRIDGYKYIETTTTTTTTDVVPLEELDENQRHFDEFSADFLPEDNYIQEVEEEEEREPELELEMGPDRAEVQEYEQESDDAFINTSHRPGEVEIVGAYGIVKENEYNSNDELERQGDVSTSNFARVIRNNFINGSFESGEETPAESNYTDALDYIPPAASTKSQLSKGSSTVAKPKGGTATGAKKGRRVVPPGQQKVAGGSAAAAATTAVGPTSSKRKGTVREPARRSSVQSNTTGLPVASKLPKRVSTVSVGPYRQQQHQHQQQQQPLSEQEMYLKALEVAKQKVYNDRIPTAGRMGPAKLTQAQKRSSMSQRMTLRNKNIPSKQSRGERRRGSVIGLKKVGATTSTAATAVGTKNNNGNNNTGQVSSTTYFGSNYATNPPRRAKLGSGGGVPDSYSNYSSNASKTTMTDEEMYARALEIAAERYNEAHVATATTASSTSSSRLKHTSALASQSTSNSSVGNLRDSKLTRLGKSKEEVKMETPEVATATGAPALATSAANNGSTPASFGTPIVTSDGAMSPSMNLTRYTSSGTAMSPLSTVTSNDNSTFGTEPKRLASNQSSLKLKKKFSLKNLLDKVVQFSQENSGYQEPKRKTKDKGKCGESGEHLVTEDQPVSDNDHPEPPINYGPGATLPVQVPLHQKQTSDQEYGSFFARHPHQQRNDIGKANSNSNTNNTTGSSSIFSKNKTREVSSQQTADVAAPSDLIDGGTGKPQMQVQMNSSEYMTGGTQWSDNAGKTASTKHGKKIKGKFFTKLFKRSKQTA